MLSACTRLPSCSRTPRPYPSKSTTTVSWGPPRAGSTTITWSCGEMTADGPAFCHAGKAPALQWGVRIADGQVFSACGQPAPPQAVVQRGDTRHARLRIRLPAYDRAPPKTKKVRSCRASEQANSAARPGQYGPASRNFPAKSKSRSSGSDVLRLGCVTSLLRQRCAPCASLSPLTEEDAHDSAQFVDSSRHRARSGHVSRSLRLR
jgi:hypothetical protein